MVIASGILDGSMALLGYPGLGKLSLASPELRSYQAAARISGHSSPISISHQRQITNSIELVLGSSGETRNVLTLVEDINNLDGT